MFYSYFIHILLENLSNLQFGKFYSYYNTILGGGAVHFLMLSPLSKGDYSYMHVHM